ncbi:hypothetical protein [Streptomyces sp. NPDC002343]
MTPRLRLTLRCLRLPAVLTAAALPWYGIAVVYGSPPAHTAEPGPAAASARHGESRPETAREAPPGRSLPGHPAPDHPAGTRSATAARPHAGRPDAERGAPEGEHPGRDHPDRNHSDRDRPDRDHPDRDHPDRDRPGRGPSPSAGLAQEGSAAPVPLPSDSASASVHPYRSLAWTEPTRAGSRAGEGRMRPGRPQGPVAEAEDEDGSAATPAVQPAEPETTDVPAASGEPPEEAGVGSATPAPRTGARQAAPRSETATEPVLRILPLGSGLVLIGLGLGLALLGLRLRRS